MKTWTELEVKDDGGWTVLARNVTESDLLEWDLLRGREWRLVLVQAIETRRTIAGREVIQ